MMMADNQIFAWTQMHSAEPGEVVQFVQVFAPGNGTRELVVRDKKGRIVRLTFGAVEWSHMVQDLAGV
jgi:hypothetical protein